jgi:hypothetical protein
MATWLPEKLKPHLISLAMAILFAALCWLVGFLVPRSI